MIKEFIYFFSRPGPMSQWSMHSVDLGSIAGGGIKLSIVYTDLKVVGFVKTEVNSNSALFLKYKKHFYSLRYCPNFCWVQIFGTVARRVNV